MSARAGVVYLVGAGPGDPGLMTVRSLELIASADVIFHDRLIPAAALAGARADAELQYVGKKPGDASVPQSEIEQRMVDAAKAGKSIVRLKGGDPFVFGRGAEEGETLRAAGVEFEVVPGITAGVAASAYAGIPVTHRDDAAAVAFVTGHEDPAKPESTLDWEALARFPGTLVFYMGVGGSARNAAALIAAGRRPDEPAAVIERGTTDRQRVVEATLETLGEVVEREDIQNPALIVVGDVAARRRGLDWLERRPLHNQRVVVTRARAQASALSERLRELGAEVVELPAIRIEARLDGELVAQAVDVVSGYALVCLTSANAVELLFRALAARGKDARSLAGVRVAAVGASTAAALRGHGIEADIVPERFVAESLVEALEDEELDGERVLVARAAAGRDLVPVALRDRGAIVDDVPIYETVRESPGEELVEAAATADFLTFSASSTVTNLLEIMGDRFPREAKIVSIGPITSETIRAAGLEVAAEASQHDVDGLIAALVALVSLR